MTRWWSSSGFNRARSPRCPKNLNRKDLTLSETGKQPVVLRTDSFVECLVYEIRRIFRRHHISPKHVKTCNPVALVFSRPCCMPRGRLLPPLTGSSWPPRDQWRHRLTDERADLVGMRAALSEVAPVFPVRRVRQDAIFVVISRPRKCPSRSACAAGRPVLLLSEDKAPAAVVDDEVSRTRQFQCDASRNLNSLIRSLWPQANISFKMYK